jgi:hypothetical protein
MLRRAAKRAKADIKMASAVVADTQSRKRETKLTLCYSAASYLSFAIPSDALFLGAKDGRRTHVRDNNARAFCVLSEIFSSLHLPIP